MVDWHEPSTTDSTGERVGWHQCKINAALREVTTALVHQSTREGIERVACDRLVAADCVEFAWIGVVDFDDDRVRVRTEAGVDDHLDDLEVDLGGELGGGPTGVAATTGEVQVVRDAHADGGYEPWRERAMEYGFRSSVAVPIEHEGSLFGVLNVYSEYEDAFTGATGEAVAHLGELIGFGIAAVGWKRVLLTNEVVEVEFRLRDVFDVLDVPAGDGVVRFERAVPLGDGAYVEHGTATPDMRDTLEALPERLPQWDEMTVREGEDGELGFEARRSCRPLSSVVASRGGRLTEFVVEDGEFYLRAQVPQGVGVRPVLEAVREQYPGMEFVSQIHVCEPSTPASRVDQSPLEALTERQRTVVESAYYAGFFEWPREATGEEVAAALDISAATFHQHLRKAERAVLERLLRGVAISG